ncbi:MAG: HD domain-containing protein [Anaerolineales bacterium]|nr:HD domain-containing protein [Anaerolineales bacterium]
MKTVYVNQLDAGMELFDQPFLLLDVVERTTKDGRPFILFQLSDATGRVGGVYWNVPDEVVENCIPGKVVLVTGDVRLYNSRLQVAALDFQTYTPESMADYVASSGQDRDEMIAELKKVIADVQDPLRQLLTDVLLEPIFLQKFSDAPAATIMHHAYVGGLLHHTLSMIPFCRLVAENYPMIDLDLLIAGVLLHDVGKVFSYETGPSFPITDDERLTGHITRGIILVDRAMDKIDGFPDELRQSLVHMLISHHGSQEWGSPVTPRTLEAVILHQIDMLDSRIQGFIDHILAEPGDGAWTMRSPMFGYELYRKVKPAENDN